jgi:hypothetical protein
MGRWPGDSGSVPQPHSVKPSVFEPVVAERVGDLVQQFELLGGVDV